MSDVPTLPSLVGYAPADAEHLAQASGYTVIWQEAFIPRWLSPHRVPRVGRQRAGAPGTVELLRVYVPIACDEEGDHP